MENQDLLNAKLRNVKKFNALKALERSLVDVEKLGVVVGLVRNFDKTSSIRTISNTLKEFMTVKT